MGKALIGSFIEWVFILEVNDSSNDAVDGCLIVNVDICVWCFKMLGRWDSKQESINLI